MILLDTGVLVASLSKRDQYHNWAVKQFQANPYPFITCEAVISEAVFFLHRYSIHISKLENLLLSGAIQISGGISQEIFAILGLIQKYENIRMDFADACLVRMAEISTTSQVLTIDSDFRIYRKHRTQRLNLIMPD